MQVSMQEFKSHLARYVVKAQAGESIELTSHRKVVARIVGVPHTEHVGLARLLTSGVASWQGGKPKGAALTLQKQGKSIAQVVLEDR